VLIVIVYGVTSGAAAGARRASHRYSSRHRWPLRSVWERCCDSLSHARERHGPPASPGYKRRRPPPPPPVFRLTHTRAHTAQFSAKLTWITTRTLFALRSTRRTHTHSRIMLHDLEQQPISRTYQYRKVSSSSETPVKNHNSCYSVFRLRILNSNRLVD
jgi:hypothetical protein